MIIQKNEKMAVCILARKRLFRNTRVVRQAKALAEAGHKVTVVAIELPCEELRSLNRNVEYIEVTIQPLLNKLMPFCNQFRLKCLSVFKKFQKKKKIIFKPTKDNFSLPKNVPPIRQFNPFFSLLVRPLAILFLLPLNPKALFRCNIVKMNDAELLRTFLLPYFNLTNSFDFAQKAKSAIGEQRFDYYKAHDTHALPAARLLSKMNGGKIVYDTLEIPEDRSGPVAKQTPWLVRFIENRIEKRIIRQAVKVMAVGQSVASYTANYYRIKMPEVIRNCCLYQNIPANNLLKKELGLTDSQKLCLVIGAIYNNQGLEQVLQALPYLPDNIHIAAMGPIAEQATVDVLKVMAVKYGVENRFHVIEAKPPQDLFKYASGADLGLIPRQASCLNNLYSLPNKIFELIMSRLPVACGNLVDIKKIIEFYKIGGFFIEKDPEDIAKVINELLEDDVKYFKMKSAVESAAKELCWEEESIKYISFMEQKLIEN